MNFSDTVLDAILDEANGIPPSTFLHYLRPQLSVRDKARKSLRTSGVSLVAITNANIKTFYAVGAVYKRGGWDVCPESWELAGIANAAEAMVALLEWGLPSAEMADLAPQMNAAYVNLSRRGRAEFQIAVDANNFADLFVFKSPAEAEAFRADELDKRKGAAKLISGLVRLPPKSL